MSDSSIYTLGGTVQAGQGIYIKRSADDVLFELCLAGRYAYVLTARQMGKSSLMVRTAQNLATQNIRTVILDMTEMGVQTRPEAWYLGLILRISAFLGIQQDVMQWWQEYAEVNAAQRLSLFFQEVVLDEIPDRIVVFIDEIDSTLALDFTDDFFAALRYLYNARAVDSRLQRISFVLIGVAEPGDLIDDPKRTPFNVGQRVEINDFSEDEAAPLAAGLPGSRREQQAALGRILYWTGGHPYLTQRLCVEVARTGDEDLEPPDLDTVVRHTFFGENSQKDNNLQFVRDMLTKHAPHPKEVLAEYQAIRLGPRPVGDDEQSRVKSHLKLSGVVIKKHGILVVRNRVYARVFDRRWIRSQWPVSWWNLLPAEVKLSVGVSLALLLAFFLAAVIAFKNQQDASRSLALAQFAQQTSAANAALAQRQSATIAVQAVTSARQAEVNRSLALAAQARLALEADNGDLALALAVEAVQINDPPRSAELVLSEAAYAPGLVSLFGGHQDPINSLDISPDGRYLLSGAGDYSVENGGQDFSVRLWEIETGKEIRRLEGHTSAVMGVDFSPDGRFALSASLDRSLIYWDLTTGEQVYHLQGHTSPVLAATISPDGQYAVSSSGRVFTDHSQAPDNSLRIWDLQSGLEIRRFDANLDSIRTLAFTPDGKLLTGSLDGTLRLQDIETGKFLFTAKARLPTILSIESCGDNRQALTSVEDMLQLWDLVSGIEIRFYEGFAGTVLNAACSPDGRRIAATDGTVILVFDTRTGNLIHRFSGNGQFSNAVAFMPDGRSLVSAGSEGALRVWSLNNGAIVQELLGHTGWVRDVSFSPDADRVISTGDDALVIWDVDDGQVLSSFPSQPEMGTFWNLAVSPDGQHAVTTLLSNLAIYWDLESGKQKHILAGDYHKSGHDGWVDAVAISPDGNYVLTGAQGSQHNLIYWDTQSGQVLRELSTVGVLGVDISPDGRYGLSGEIDANTKLWDLSSGRLVRVFEGHTGLVWSVAFSPDGKRFLSGSEDGSLILWDVSSGNLIRRMPGHQQGVKQVSISPDGTLGLSAARDGTLILWDLASGEALRRYQAHFGQARTVAFHPQDNRIALSGGDDGRLLVWRLDLTVSDLLKWTSTHRYVRSFTCTEREIYEIEPLCSQFTEYENNLQTAPAPDPAHVVYEATVLPSSSRNAKPTSTSTPMMPVNTARWGDNQGEIPIGGGQLWEYAGQEGEKISIGLQADKPANGVFDQAEKIRRDLLDITLQIYTPDGSLLIEADDIKNALNTDVFIAALTLPETGVYQFVVRSYQNQTGGAYTLSVGFPKLLSLRHTAPGAHSFAISPDGRIVVVGGGKSGLLDTPTANDNSIIAWDLNSGEVMMRLEGHSAEVGNLAFSADGTRLFSTSSDGKLIVWNFSRGTKIREIKAHKALISAFEISPDGRKMLTASFDSSIFLWDSDSGALIHQLQGHDGPVFVAKFVPDGQLILSTGADKSLRVWDVRSGRLLHTYYPFGDGPQRSAGLAISPDGQTALVGGGEYFGPAYRDPVITQIDIHTGENLQELYGHEHVVFSLDISSDGRFALSGSWDHTVRLWDLQLGVKLASSTYHNNYVMSVAFSQDNQTAYSVSLDGTLHIWDITPYLLFDE